MIYIRRYSSEDKADWDAFIRESKNGTFLLERAYMDYHSDRFCDHSLMLYDQGEHLIGVLPADSYCIEGRKTLFSHRGLTYGGLILSAKGTMTDVMDMFSAIISYLRNEGYASFYYKQIPSCYHLIPAEEDEYALWRNNARLEVVNISSCVPLYNITMDRRKRWASGKAVKMGYTIQKTHDKEALADFWKVMEQNMAEKYHARPVHSVAEMLTLMQSFPENILLFTAVHDGKIEAGAVLYVTKQTVHVQYAHASTTGMKHRAIDLLYCTLIEKYSHTHRFFDIGTSNEDKGRYLNTSLIAQKEGFGARGISYKQWRLDL